MLHRFFDPEASSGLSLAEIMVGVAITGIVSVFAMNQVSDFTRRQWEAETKSNAVAETELAADAIKKTLPQFVYSVTGSNGETAPPSNFWSCNSTSCVMQIDYQYTNIDGAAGAPLPALRPIQADCVPIQDAKLATAGVGLDEKAALPFPAPPAVRTGDHPSCLSCATGKAPRLIVRTYNFDATTGVPSIAGTFYYPKRNGSVEQVGSMNRQSNLAMGICVETLAYQENLGTALQPLNVNRYDRWKISLIPVYSRIAPTAQRSEAQIKSDLQSPVTEILISAPQRFAPGFRITPVR
jgi:hypothetical protein